MYELINRGAKARKQARRKKHNAIKRWKREQKLAKKSGRDQAKTYENKVIIY